MQHSETHSEASSRKAFTIAEVANLLGVHKSSVYRILYTGKIKVLSRCKRLMIPETELQKFLNRVEVYAPRKRGRKAVTA
jgi:excisionase family DNA binding protein